jgi:ketopantoate reductase
MLTNETTIAMLGAGAIGGVTAIFIQQSGHQLEIICNLQETEDKIANQGLHITGIKGEHRAHMKAVAKIGLKYRRIKSSSLQAIERGRRTEIDFLNGYLCDRGREHGVPTPANDAVCDTVREIEDGNRQMSLENIKSTAFI